MDLGYFDKLKIISNFPENDYITWTITAFPKLLESGKEIMFDTISRNYSDAVEYCKNRDGQIVLPGSSQEKSGIVNILLEALAVGHPMRGPITNNCVVHRFQKFYVIWHI